MRFVLPLGFPKSGALKHCGCPHVPLVFSFSHLLHFFHCVVIVVVVVVVVMVVIVGVVVLVLVLFVLLVLLLFVLLVLLLLVLRVLLVLPVLPVLSVLSALCVLSVFPLPPLSFSFLFFSRSYLVLFKVSFASANGPGCWSTDYIISRLVFITYPLFCFFSVSYLLYSHSLSMHRTQRESISCFRFGGVFLLMFLSLFKYCPACTFPHKTHKAPNTGSR